MSELKDKYAYKVGWWRNIAIAFIIISVVLSLWTFANSLGSTFKVIIIIILLLVTCIITNKFSSNLNCESIQQMIKYLEDTRNVKIKNIKHYVDPIGAKLTGVHVPCLNLTFKIKEEELGNFKLVGYVKGTIKDVKEEIKQFPLEEAREKKEQEIIIDENKKKKEQLEELDI